MKKTISTPEQNKMGNKQEGINYKKLRENDMRSESCSPEQGCLLLLFMYSVYLLVSLFCLENVKEKNHHITSNSFLNCSGIMILRVTTIIICEPKLR